MRSNWCLIAAVVLSAVPCWKNSTAQGTTVEEAVEAHDILHMRQACLDVGDCSEPFSPPSSDYREQIHSLHEVEPALFRVAELGADTRAFELAQSVCAIVDDTYVVETPKWTYLPAVLQDFPALLDHEPEWALVRASTGFLIEFNLTGELTRHGVLTVGHTATHNDVCAGTESYLFVFGLTEYTYEQRDGQDYIKVPTEHVARAECTMFYLRTDLTDAAFYEIDSTITEQFSPYVDGIIEVDSKDEVYSIGFPQGLAMRMTQGEVDPFTLGSPQRTYNTNMFSQNGMSGAPVFHGGTLAGMHLDSWAVRSLPEDCLACPLPCDVRAAGSEFGAVSEPECTTGGSWSTEAGYPQLVSLFDLPVVTRTLSVTAAFTRLRAERGARFLVRRHPRRPFRVRHGDMMLGPGDSVRVFLPPGSRLGILGRPDGEQQFRWKYFEADALRKSREYEFLPQPRRLEIRDPTNGRHDFSIVSMGRTR